MLSWILKSEIGVNLSGWGIVHEEVRIINNLVGGATCWKKFSPSHVGKQELGF